MIVMSINQFVTLIVSLTVQVIVSYGLSSSSYTSSTSLSSLSSSLSSSSATVTSSSANCSLLSGCESEGPLCSSEGKTYKTKCDLIVDQCKRSGITVIANYPCSSCLLERNANLAVKAESDHQSGKEILIPECDLSKGLYKAQQCHKETGYCWCVDVNHGKPIWKTSAKGDKAATDCDILALKVNRRRRPRRDKKKCTKAEKTELIRELISLFSVEYEKQFKSKQSDVQILLRHKFSTLDVDKDEYITRREFKDFRSSINQRTKQNNCVASFFKVIDTNSDKQISLTEWISFHTTSSPREFSDRSDRSESKNFQASPSDIAMWSSNIGAVHGLLLLNQKTESESQKEKDEDPDDQSDADDNGFSIESIVFKPNCTESRLIALKNSPKFNHTKTLIPLCNKQDPYLYNDIQCHELPGFCFCVKPTTGQLIPGISSKLPAKPDCSQPRIVRKKLSHPRKGCFPQKAHRFKRFLIKNFNEEYRHEKSSGQKLDVSSLISWKFNKIDSDGNRLIETSEWAAFELSLKSLISRIQNFKKCARNFVQRDCDSNQDGKIEWKEWRSCIYLSEAQRVPHHRLIKSATVEAPSLALALSPSLSSSLTSSYQSLDQSSSSGHESQPSDLADKRKGRNPFLPILKD